MSSICGLAVQCCFQNTLENSKHYRLFRDFPIIGCNGRAECLEVSFGGPWVATTTTRRSPNIYHIPMLWYLNLISLTAAHISMAIIPKDSCYVMPKFGYS